MTIESLALPRGTGVPAFGTPVVGRVAVRSSRQSSEFRRFGRLQLLGLLWAVIVIALEVPTVSFDVPLGSTAYTLAHMALMWIPVGSMLAVGIHWATIDRVHWWRVIVAVPIASALSILPLLLLRVGEMALIGRYAVDWVLGPDFPMVPLLVYTSWLVLAYGGLAAVIYALRRNIDLTTATLRHTALARERNEAAIADARFQAMVERIEPQFLLDVMDAARSQYRSDPERAEATLNACVSFLRAAMPQLRSGVSSVTAELELAGDYLRLRDSMGGPRRRWRIEDRATGTAIDLRGVPLPPMTLLPILDRFMVAGPTVDDEPLAIVVSGGGDEVEIHVSSQGFLGPDDRFDAEWLEALDLRLALACGRGANAELTREASTRTLLKITLPPKIR